MKLYTKYLLALLLSTSTLSAHGLVIHQGGYYYNSTLDPDNFFGHGLVWARASVTKHQSYFDLKYSSMWDDGYRFATVDQVHHLFSSVTGFNFSTTSPDAPYASEINGQGYDIFLDLMGVQAEDRFLYGADNSITQPLTDDFTAVEQMDLLMDAKMRYGTGVAFLPETDASVYPLTGTLLMTRILPNESTRARYTPVYEPPLMGLFMIGLVGLVISRKNASLF